MSQALYTSMGGISAAQTQIDVVSNNIANLNTVGFKQSNVTFQDIFSTTMSAGSAPTVTAGGKNPIQIGLGVQVGTIARNLASGTWTATGRPTDIMIQGNGFFTVKTADGNMFLTKAGNFSFDAAGDMVNAQGYKVLGTKQIFGAIGSETTVNVPQKIVTKVTANTAMYDKALTALNSCQLTGGDFYLTVTPGAGAAKKIPIVLDTATATTMGQISAAINVQLNAASAAATAASGAALAAAGASLTGNPSAATERAASGDAPLATPPANAAAATAEATTANAVATHKAKEAGYYGEARNLMAAGALVTEANVVIALNKAAAARADAGDAPLAPGTITDAATALTQQNLAITRGTHKTNEANYYTEAATQYTNSINETAASDAFLNTRARCDATTGGTLKFVLDGTLAKSAAFAPGTSNFVLATQIGSASIDPATHTYTSKVLDQQVDISPVTSLDDAVSIANYTIGDDGSIEATYSNGDKLAIETNKTDNTFQFKYTTSTGVIIRDDDAHVNQNVAIPSNFQIQMANVVNPEGLVAMGGNLFMVGPNAGDMVFTIGGVMGVGQLKTGGLESSNVDMSEQFSNMILAQRAVQANSRVFSTSNEVMQTLVMLGR